jgi:hypothetical protein
MFSFRLAGLAAVTSALLLVAPLSVMAGRGGGGGGGGGGRGGGFGGGFGGRGGYGGYGRFGGYGYGGFGYGFGGFYPGYGFGYGYGGYYPGFGYGGSYPGYGYGGYGAIYSGYGGTDSCGCGCDVGAGSASTIVPFTATASTVVGGRQTRYVDYYTHEISQVTWATALSPASRYIDYYTRKPVAPTSVAANGNARYVKYDAATEATDSEGVVIQAGSTNKR